MQRKLKVALDRLFEEPRSDVAESGIGMSSRLFLAAQILVGFVDPVGARRIENVEVHRIFERFGLVRHVRRDAENFSGMHDNLLAIDPEL